VAADDLSAPLGQNKRRKQGFQVPKIVPHLLIAALSLSLLTFGGWIMLKDDPFGGEPMAVASADLRSAGTDQKNADATGKPARPEIAVETAQPAVPPGSKTISIIDGSTGKRQDVLVPNGDEKPTGDERLSEKSRHGPLPRIGQDGARPSDAFARAAKPIAGKPNAPMIAIVIGGLGVGTNNTNDAMKKLPGAVTFAFGAYGSDLERQVMRARGEGHEIMLQIPMEPFDYPDNDPGPQTLLSSLDAAQNVDRLHWLMSRFQGYVGVTNVMGARFTSSEQALAPVMKETAKRGLIYLDDGSSTRSLASQIAGANNTAFAKADVVLDAVPTSADVDRALNRLEAIARERGLAIGTANALPVSIERIARWAKGAEGRGVVLAPVTAIVSKAKSSS
jgi:polysaccharide deacetylase 2 family uncharacterized protein YibQ